LRLGDIGYTNHRENEIGIKACYDNLQDYVKCLTRAIETPYQPYEEIGIQSDGEYRQLNANILQIENEYYGTVRPKQISNRNEKPTHALMRRGVRYVEIRSMDINPFSAIGIDQAQLDFVEVLFMYCLLGDDAIISETEQEEIDFNEYEVAHHGRKPDLHLRRAGESIPINEWAEELFIELQLVADLMGDKALQYQASLAVFADAISDQQQTLSAKMLQQMQQSKLSFYDFIATMGKQYCDQFSEMSDADLQKNFSYLAEQSMTEQQQIERADKVSFSDFLTAYFSQHIDDRSQ